ncbi:MAG: glycosyltransferase family 2 protein [Vulcanimicrobiaceae bacterium]
MKIVVVIPALNEAESIAHVIAAIPAELEARVVVVDNGSTDATAAVARAAGAVVVRTDPPGYGRACRYGAERARADGADAIVFLDGDYSDDPADMHALLAPLRSGDADLVIGSRLRGRLVPGAMAWHARLGNRLISAMMRAIYGLPITDLGPFRAIRADFYASLAMNEMTYGWPVEMLAKAARQKGRVREIAVAYRPRIGRSKISGTIRGTIGATYFLLTRTFVYARWRARA